jgi:hypothetical protein
LGRVEIGEASALLGEPVEVWSLDVRRAEAAKVLVALVIGEDHDEVRPIGHVTLGRTQRPDKPSDENQRSQE